MSKPHDVKIERDRYDKPLRVWVEGERLKLVPSDKRGVRRTFIGREIVLKTAWECGEQFDNEVDAYKQMPEQLRAFIPPLLAYEPNQWSIWLRIRGLRIATPKRWQRDIAKAIARIFSSYDIQATTRSAHNCGVDPRGRLWVFDLGC